MAIEYMFFNAVENAGVYDRTYNAEQFSSWLDEIVGNGVFAYPSNNLQVMADEGMHVTVKAGAAWIYGHKMTLDADMSISVPQADVALDKIDTIIAYCDWQSRSMGIELVEGTPAASPVPVAVNQTKGIRFELRLADIYVTHQATTITQSNITDKRSYPECGYVAGLIDQLDTSTLFAQWTDAWERWFSEIREGTWSANFISKVETTFTLTAGTDRIIVEDYISDFVAGQDVLEVYFNGLRLALDTDYTESAMPAGWQVDFLTAPSADVNCTLVTFKPIQI